MAGTEYHKIQSIYKRDVRGRLLLGDWARPEIGYLAGCQWEWTEKVDGTNIRIGCLPAGETTTAAGFPVSQGGFFVGGRTDRAQIPASFLTAVDSLGLRESLPAYFAEALQTAPVVLYGEGYGPKIQRGGKYRGDQGFVLFDVRVGPWWLERPAVEDVASKLGLDVVPVVGRGTLAEAEARVRAGLRSTWGDFDAEGIVCRPLVRLFDNAGIRILVKIKGRDLQRAVPGRGNCEYIVPVEREDGPARTARA